MTPIGAAAGALMMLVAVVQLQGARERLYPASESEPDAVYVSSGSALRRLTGAYNTLAADVYWVRAIQYFGATRRRLVEERSRGPEPPPALAATPDEYPNLFPLLDITTSLDPRFNIAYRFGAVFLAEPPPGGPGRPDLAIKLLEKGLAERPDKWEYMEDIGFVHYWYRHDYREAAVWFGKAADIPKAPWWLRSLAATTLAQGGDRASSRLISFGARAPGMRTAPITTSACMIVCSISRLDDMSRLTRPERISSRCRIRSIDRSRTVTRAPRPRAMIAEL